MSETRNGKIARLPKYIRDDLCRRIENGELGRELVKWLNGLSDVQEVLKEQFGGRAVTEQNLSEWKLGGYPEWLRREETRLLVSSLTEQSDELDETADGQEISDRFAGVFAAELTRLAATLLEKETDPEKRWQRLREVHRELSQLRRDDHRAVRTSIKRDRWNRQVECEIEEAGERSDKEYRKRLCAPFLARLELGPLAEWFGGSDAAWNIAAYILEIQNKLPFGRLGRKGRDDQVKPSPVSPNPTQSDLIRPDQTNFSNGHTPSGNNYENPS
jgi:hypothetical protein